MTETSDGWSICNFRITYQNATRIEQSKTHLSKPKPVDVFIKISLKLNFRGKKRT